MHRAHIQALLLAVSLPAMPAVAGATAMREPAPAGGARYDNLPLTVSAPATLVASGRVMPAAQTIMKAFAARGYVRRSELDLGEAPEPGENAVVCLVYEKPGYVAPDHCAGAPLITIVTALVDGRPSTVVSGDFVVVDTLYQTFTVTRDGPEAGSLTISGATPDRIELTDDQRAILLQYVGCAGIGNLGCLANAVPLAFIGPAAYTAGAVGCVMLNTGHCLSNAIGDWFHHH